MGLCQSPANTTTTPDNTQIITVQNTEVAEIMPMRVTPRVLAAQAAMAALPRPASVHMTPRDTPQPTAFTAAMKTA